MVLIAICFFIDTLLLSMFPTSLFLSSFTYPMLTLIAISYLSSFKDHIIPYFVFAAILYGVVILDSLLLSAFLFMSLYFIIMFFKRWNNQIFLFYLVQCISILFFYDFLIFVLFTFFRILPFSFSLFTTKFLSSIFLNLSFSILLYEITQIILKHKKHTYH